MELASFSKLSKKFKASLAVMTCRLENKRKLNSIGGKWHPNPESKLA